MTIDIFSLAFAVALGFGATILMDVSGVLLRAWLSIPMSNYCLVGRWLLYMPVGVFTHTNIVKAEPKRGECVCGWIAHYLVGILFASLFVLLCSAAWLKDPTILPALTFGLATTVMPFFIMQPAFGLGLAGAKTPNPRQTRLRSIVNHSVFGVGLYFSAAIVSLFVSNI